MRDVLRRFRHPTPPPPDLFVACDEVVQALVLSYVERLALPLDQLQVTTDRAVYGRWLGRKIPSAYGGAYCYLRHADRHAVLINLDRIDRSKPWAVEVVVCEELVHMRDHLDGDHRRHAKHGHDRIAYRVAAMTGRSLDEIRSALLPVQRRPYRYMYACPNCGMQVPRKKKGRWACGICAERVGKRYVLRIVGEFVPVEESGGGVQ